MQQGQKRLQVGREEGMALNSSHSVQALEELLPGGHWDEAWGWLRQHLSSGYQLAVGRGSAKTHLDCPFDSVGAGWGEGSAFSPPCSRCFCLQESILTGCRPCDGSHLPSPVASPPAPQACVCASCRSAPSLPTALLHPEDPFLVQEGASSLHLGWVIHSGACHRLVITAIRDTVWPEG